MIKAILAALFPLLLIAVSVQANADMIMPKNDTTQMPGPGAGNMSSSNMTLPANNATIMYNETQVYVERVLTRQGSNGTFHSWVIIEAVDGIEVDHLNIAVNNTDIISAIVLKNWILTLDASRIDMHGLRAIHTIGHVPGHGVVIKLVTEKAPEVQITGATHH